MSSKLKIAKITGGALLVLCTVSSGVAQQSPGDSTVVPEQIVADTTNSRTEELGPSGRELSGVLLPSLDELYYNAEQAPGVLVFEKQREFEVLQLRREKRNFLSFFNLHGNYAYGNGTVNTQLFDQNGMPIPQTYSKNLQSNYNMGASIVIPLDLVFDLGGAVKRQRKQLERVDYERLSALEERKVTIATLYARIVSYIPIVKAATEKMVFANAQYVISESDFINGQLNASEINVEKSRQILALTEYENARSELYGLLLQLEIISNTTIITTSLQ